MQIRSLLAVQYSKRNPKFSVLTLYWFRSIWLIDFNLYLLIKDIMFSILLIIFRKLKCDFFSDCILSFPSELLQSIFVASKTDVEY